MCHCTTAIYPGEKCFNKINCILCNGYWVVWENIKLCDNTQLGAVEGDVKKDLPSEYLVRRFPLKPCMLRTLKPSEILHWQNS